MIEDKEKLIKQITLSLSSETRSCLSDLCRYMRKNSMWFDHESAETFKDIAWLEDNV
jgi:hypothetical protein